jgi:4-diphosphocytidyl-2-C-methyl-D-erythritol kinase
MITRPNVKINLGLNVLRKRDDGYHDLETLFIPYFGFRDTLEIIAGDDWSRTSASLFERYGGSAVATGSDGGPADGRAPDCAAPRLVQAVSPDGRLMITIARAEGVDWDPLKDLTAKAFYLLAADFDLPPVKIFLEKTSPVGAGLGGGSADAAFALRMLSELACLGLSDAELAAYAARLGSDCAFFIHNRPMLGTGRGEILSPAPAGLPAFVSDKPGDNALKIEVVIPEGVVVSTAEAYRGVTPHLPLCPLKDVLTHPVDEWKDLLINDFEPSVFARHPSLADIKQALYDRGARYAAMSGSGSALFGLF